MRCFNPSSVAAIHNRRAAVESGIIMKMRRVSFVFLTVGFAIGFGVLYFWTKQREPQIVSAMPTRLVLPSDSASSNGPADAQSQTPPPDPAEVQKLLDRVKANPKDFEAIVGLGNIDFDQRNYSAAADYYKRALAIHDDLEVRTDLFGDRSILARVADEEIVFAAWNVGHTPPTDNTTWKIPNFDCWKNNHSRSRPGKHSEPRRTIRLMRLHVPGTGHVAVRVRPGRRDSRDSIAGRDRL